MNSISYRSRHIVPTIITGILACASFAQAEEAPHVDPYISAQGGQLHSAGWDPSTDSIVDSTTRVFGADFGEDPSFPFATEDPGFGSNLLGSTINVNLLAGLSNWTGTEFVSFTDASVTAEFGGASGNTTTGGGFSFLVGVGLHLHPSYFINGVGGLDPANGIYLVSLNATSSQYAASNTFWFVFNLGESEEDHDAAIEWVNTNLVPAPAGLIAILCGFPIGLRRRRRG